MPQKLEFWLVRHGETEFSVNGRHSGRYDIALTPRGEREAEALRGVLKPEDFATVLCSPLQRARKTCEIAGFAAIAKIEPEIMEWDYGECTSFTQDQLREKYPGWNIWGGPVPNGESIAEIALRASRVIEEYGHVRGRVLLFAHGHFLRIFATQFLNLPPQAGMYLALDPCAVSVLGQDAGFPAIRQWNRVY